MHRLFGLLALITLITEEICHQRVRSRGGLPSEPTDDNEFRHTLDRFDVLRLLELLLLALILSTVAGNPSTSAGQLSMVLVGLQIARLFGRKILSRWSVLGVLQALEILLVGVLISVPFKPPVQQAQPSSALEVFALTGGILYGILITLCIAFSLSYGIKLFSREGSSTYETFPPLADSEMWAVRFSTNSLIAGAAGGICYLLTAGLSVSPILFSVSVVLNASGLILAKQGNFTGHHPKSHVLWGLAFLIILAMLISGSTAAGSG